LDQFPACGHTQGLGGQQQEKGRSEKQKISYLRNWSKNPTVSRRTALRAIENKTDPFVSANNRIK